MATAQSNGDDRKIRAEESESLLTEKSTSTIVLSETFNFADHAKNAFKVFESYCNDLWLTDVTLVTGSKRIDAHRLVLSVSSPYFATMFKSLFKESIQDEIEMKEINQDALLALVQYCYTGSIELREDNIEVLFATARLLQMDPVVEACTQFLIKQLDPCNCLGIKTLADAQGCDSLSSTAHAYALEYFVQVVRNEEFLLLSADKVAEFLESDDVNVPSEETIFNALTTWLKHDSINRIKDASKLIGHVRLPLLMPEFIAGHIEGNGLFNDQKAIQDSIFEAYRYHLLRKPTDSLLKSGRTRPRKSTADILLALVRSCGKQDGKESPLPISLEALDPRKNTWKHITNMKERMNFGAVCIEEKLFVVGGLLNGTPTNTVESFDFTNQLWETWPSMQTCRHVLGVATLNGFLYAIGGKDDRWESMNTVERYDLVAQKWNFVAPMSTQRSDAGVGVLNNKLYVAGGDGKIRLKTMECYDPKTNKWSFCSPMSEARSGGGIGVLNGYIYAIGGVNKNVWLNSVERYDPETDKWTGIAPMNVQRCGAGIGVLGNRLFVVGGFSVCKPLTSVEAYDPALNEWQELEPLGERRVKHCVVVDRRICKL